MEFLPKLCVKRLILFLTLSLMLLWARNEINNVQQFWLISYFINSIFLQIYALCRNRWYCSKKRTHEETCKFIISLTLSTNEFKMNDKFSIELNWFQRPANILKHNLSLKFNIKSVFSPTIAKRCPVFLNQSYFCMTLNAPIAKSRIPWLLPLN